MTALISKIKFNPLYIHLQGPNYGLDGLNITMHTEVVIHLMNAYVWCWSKICFQDIARTRFYRSRSLRQGQRSNQGQIMTLHNYIP